MKIEFIKPPDTYFLRHSILRPHQPMEQCHYPGDFTGTTFHLGASQGGAILAVGSFYLERNLGFEEKDQFRLRGMATSSEVRGQGFGKVLLDEGKEILRQRGATLLWCNAREVAFDFYTKVGFSFHGPTFDLPEIGRHKVMFIRL
jgi:GNAT superfamily N-acetyltransferase